MYGDWLVNFAVAGATLAALVLCVLLHYEGLVFVFRGLARVGHGRIKVLYAINSVLLLHISQIWVFGGVLWALLRWPEFGSLGAAAPNLLDAVYFSAVTFTTVGYGDLAPSGPIRFLAGTESLAGFVLLAWSASFTYLEMERYWRPKDRPG
jgi:hypothetical protein